MAEPANIRRVAVQRYTKSGKLVAIFHHGGYVGYTVLELSPAIDSIRKIRNPHFFRSEALSPTKFQVDIEETLIDTAGGSASFSYRLVRVLTPEDTDLARWMSTESLDALPVSPGEALTPEERAWAGERKGNVGGGIVLGAVMVGAALLSMRGYSNGSSYVFSALIAIVTAFFLIKYPWKPSQKPLPAKLDELKTYKNKMRQQASVRFTTARTAFEKALDTLAAWENLSPRDFEAAVSTRLEQEGFTVKRARYAQDGGVDVEAIDDHGLPVIVQAKQHLSKVGASVVREMIGIRESRPVRPRTIIYSLVGFTRGAEKLADSQGIELRDVRSELLHL